MQQLIREEAENLTGPELTKAQDNGSLSRELAKELFTVDRVAIIPGPAAHNPKAKCEYSIRVYGWGRWWMPSLPPSAKAAWEEAQQIAEEYKCEVEFLNVDKDKFKKEAGIS